MELGLSRVKRAHQVTVGRPFISVGLQENRYCQNMANAWFMVTAVIHVWKPDVEIMLSMFLMQGFSF